MKNELPTPMYRVEISGWDLQGQFFVEHSVMEWRANEPKSARIQRRVQSGTLVFLRLLERSDAPAAFPVAYRLRNVGASEDNKSYEVQLAQMWPAPETHMEHPVDRPSGACAEKARNYWMGSQWGELRGRRPPSLLN
jgi:hypothetical protein